MRLLSCPDVFKFNAGKRHISIEDVTALLEYLICTKVFGPKEGCCEKRSEI